MFAVHRSNYRALKHYDKAHEQSKQTKSGALKFFHHRSTSKYNFQSHGFSSCLQNLELFELHPHPLNLKQTKLNHH